MRGKSFLCARKIGRERKPFGSESRPRSFESFVTSLGGTKRDRESPFRAVVPLLRALEESHSIYYGQVTGRRFDHRPGGLEAFARCIARSVTRENHANGESAGRALPGSLVPAPTVGRRIQWIRSVFPGVRAVLSAQSTREVTRRLTCFFLADNYPVSEATRTPRGLRHSPRHTCRAFRKPDERFE